MTALDQGGLRSPLLQRHESLGAKLGDFAGWQMPLQYPTGVLAEHASVRERVGIFDVSHLGTVWVTGRGAADFINSCFTNDINRISKGQAQYTLCCNELGGVVDDVFVYRVSDDRLLCVPNAANTGDVAQLLAKHAPHGVEVENTHGSSAIIAVQGPSSTELLNRVGLASPGRYLSFHTVQSGTTGSAIMVCRSGYTGERGYELIVPSGDAALMWDHLLNSAASVGGAPCGLAARDTLRTEMGYPLHGHELGPDVTPLEARLGWAVAWAKPAFWGRDALLEQRAAGPARALVGLKLPDRAIARPGMVVRAEPGAVPRGVITSGTFSPTLGTGIALALVDTEMKADAAGEDSATVVVDVRGREVIAAVTAPPFVVTHGLR